MFSKPTNAVFEIRVDGKLIPPRFPSVAAAEAYARLQRLQEHHVCVEVVRVSYESIMVVGHERYKQSRRSAPPWMADNRAGAPKVTAVARHAGTA